MCMNLPSFDQFTPNIIISYQVIHDFIFLMVFSQTVQEIWADQLMLSFFFVYNFTVQT